MKLLSVLSIPCLLVSAFFSNAAGSKFTAKPNEAVFQVHGVVCSFCSAGLRKKLSKLPFVDHSRYKKGIHVTIKNQRITMAVKPDATVDLKAVYKSIKSGGYDLIKAVVADGKGVSTYYDKKGNLCIDCS